MDYDEGRIVFLILGWKLESIILTQISFFAQKKKVTHRVVPWDWMQFLKNAADNYFEFDS